MDTLTPLVPDLADLVQIIHGPNGGSGLVSTLGAYCDESYNDRSRVFVVAGLLAPASRWNCFWGAWDRALIEENLPKLHWADCEGGYGHIFEPIDKSRREALQRRFLGIMSTPEYALAGFAVAIKVQEYEPLRAKIEEYRKPGPRSPVSGSLGDPYLLAFQSVVELMADYKEVTRLPPDDQIAFVFDRQKTLQGRAAAIYADLCAIDAPHTKRLGTIAFADSTKIKPLQAADALAYEAYRFCEDGLDGRPPRWQWEEAKKCLIGGVVFDTDALLALIQMHEDKGRSDP